MKRLLSGSLALASLAVSHGALAQSPKRPSTPAPRHLIARGVNFDRNAEMPGYLVERGGAKVCLPFMPTDQLVPADYTGRDFYGEEFTDAKIRDRWAECRKKPGLRGAGDHGRAKGFVIGREAGHRGRRPCGQDRSGRGGRPQAIRRPAYFGKAPYHEPIAQAEARTFTVEFTVPRDNYERLHLKKDDPIKLRGWYLQGAGVDDGAGRKVAGPGHHEQRRRPRDHRDRRPRVPGRRARPATGKWVAGKFPDAATEEPGDPALARVHPRAQPGRLRRAGHRPARQRHLGRRQRLQHGRAGQRHVPRARAARHRRGPARPDPVRRDSSPARRLRSRCSRARGRGRSRS